MIDFSNSRNDKHPLLRIANDLSLEQRMSVYALLHGLAVCDIQYDINNKELILLNEYSNDLSVQSENCESYLVTAGIRTVIDNIKTIGPSHKELFIITTWELIHCDGDLNHEEFTYLENAFKLIGISMEVYTEIIKKHNGQ